MNGLKTRFAHSYSKNHYNLYNTSYMQYLKDPLSAEEASVLLLSSFSYIFSLNDGIVRPEEIAPWIFPERSPEISIEFGVMMKI